MPSNAPWCSRAARSCAPKTCPTDSWRQRPHRTERAPPLSLEEIERRHIEQVLADSATLEEAAARLGVNPTTLWRKRKRYGL